MKLPIDDFEFGIDFLRIGDWGFRIENWGKEYGQDTNPQLRITN